MPRAWARPGGDENALDGRDVRVHAERSVSAGAGDSPRSGLDVSDTKKTKNSVGWW